MLVILSSFAPSSVIANEYISCAGAKKCRIIPEDTATS